MHSEYDTGANQVIRFLRYERWHDATLTGAELQTVRLQRWTSDEFSVLLGEAGFTGIRIAADYDDTLAARSARRVWTFRASARR